MTHYSSFSVCYHVRIGDWNVHDYFKFNNVPDRLGHDRRYGLDSSKLHRVVGDDYTTINLKEYLQTRNYVELHF